MAENKNTLASNTQHICDIVRENELEKIPPQVLGLPGIYQSARIRFDSLVISVSNKPTSTMLSQFASHFIDFAKGQGHQYTARQEEMDVVKIDMPLSTGDKLPVYEVRNMGKEVVISKHAGSQNIIPTYLELLLEPAK